MSRLTDPEEIQKALCAFFPLEAIKWKPQTAKGNSALAVAYLDARAIEDRLDQVVGVDGWQDEYEVLNDGSVICRLSLRFGGKWVTKQDVGSPSEQADGGDRMKAAFSDALKRCAVKFGIGRFVYSLPKQWCDYDPQKKRFVNTPKLPAWALPKLAGKAAPQTVEGENPPSAKAALKKPAEKAAPAEKNAPAEKTYAWSGFCSSVDRRSAEIGAGNQIVEDDIREQAYEFAYSIGVEPEQPVTKTIVDKVVAWLAATEKVNTPVSGKALPASGKTAPAEKTAPAGKTIVWAKFAEWVDENAADISSEMGLDAQAIEDAAMEILSKAGGKKNSPVAQEVADEVEAYFLKISGAETENDAE